MSGKLFWLAAAASLVAIGMAFKGYDAMTASLGLLLVSVITLKISTDGGGKAAREVKNELSGRLSSIDGMVQDLTKAFKEQSEIKDFTLGALENMKADMRIEVKDSIDRMAEKTIEMENSMGQMKRTFSAAFASLDDRMRAMEPQLRLSANTGDLTPEIKLQGADEEYVELGHDGNTAE